MFVKNLLWWWCDVDWYGKNGFKSLLSNDKSKDHENSSKFVALINRSD